MPYRRAKSFDAAPSYEYQTKSEDVWAELARVRKMILDKDQLIDSLTERLHEAETSKIKRIEWYQAKIDELTAETAYLKEQLCQENMDFEMKERKMREKFASELKQE